MSERGTEGKKERQNVRVRGREQERAKAARERVGSFGEESGSVGQVFAGTSHILSQAPRCEFMHS